MSWRVFGGVGRIRLAWDGLVTSGSSAHLWIMALLTLFVVAGAAWSAVRVGVSLSRVAWAPVVGALILSLAAPFLSAAEYRTSLLLTGRDTDFRTAIQVAVYGTLANVLPLPGGFLVRLKAMTEQGARSNAAAGAQFMVGLVWLTLGAALLAIALPRWRLVAIATTVVLALSCLGLLIRNRYLPKATLWVVTVEAAFLGSAAVRFYLVLAALGVEVSGQAALALAASGPLAAATGLIPGSLGVLEAVSAGLAALADLDPESGFLGALVLRVLTYLTLLPWVWWGRSRNSVSPNREPGS